MRKSELLDFATRMAEDSGKLVMSKFRNIKECREKSKHDFVTEADMESDRLIISRIKTEYPDHGITTEESGEFEGNKYRWLIDPLDGTNNYTYGIPVFGVSIALLKNDKPFIGVINMPVLREMFYAQKGKGAFMNEKEIHVSCRKFDDSFLIYDPHLRGTKRKEQMLRGLSTVIDRVARVRILGAATMNLTLIANGSADMWFERPIRSWDIAAGALIVEEAEGKVTDFHGKRWDPFMNSIVVSNGRVHDEMLEMIKDIFGF